MRSDAPTSLALWPPGGDPGNELLTEAGGFFFPDYFPSFSLSFIFCVHVSLSIICLSFCLSVCPCVCLSVCFIILLAFLFYQHNFSFKNSPSTLLKGSCLVSRPRSLWILENTSCIFVSRAKDVNIGIVSKG